MTKRNPKYAMWMYYDKMQTKALNVDTRKLSMIAARYEVWHDPENKIVGIQVRCREGSRVYQLCEQMHYIWSAMQAE